MANKLARIGVPTVTVTGHNVDRATALAAVSTKDTVVVFALNDEFEAISTQVLAVEKTGAAVVLLTDEDSLMFGELPQQVIAIPRDRARH
jgi:DNA-binding MurR/RpiR family transcriptional regulator